MITIKDKILKSFVKYSESSGNVEEVEPHTLYLLDSHYNRIRTTTNRVPVRKTKGRLLTAFVCRDTGRLLIVTEAFMFSSVSEYHMCSIYRNIECYLLGGSALSLFRTTPNLCRPAEVGI